MTLVGFCDSSEQGYAAAVYLYIRSDSCHCYSHLLKAKTKVAPLKVMSIPLLELCADLLFAQLVKSVQMASLPILVTASTLFSDSQIVLFWILTPPHLLKTFVANRLVSISEAVPLATWAHIPSALNPANLPSRGLGPELFIVPDTLKFWLRGPDFLVQAASAWPPPFRLNRKLASSLPELKQENACFLAESKLTNPLIDEIERFSTFIRLRRVFAWVKRFLHNSQARRNRLEPKTGPLTPDELDESLFVIVKITQKFYFNAELEMLKGKGKISPKVQALTHFIDERGLLRVGGRLSQSTLVRESKHPVLLPKVSHLS
ncbi:uncharacterized protein LOC106665787 [Cimex lectularius]|uniref:Uncharacterized protein n=1 Tax=Cimex lectularius TaxID=79782 RepID=A0A8I6TDW3_CIMLE|nr:uncharacterized protein LOC106665787 [Cimex lectularius]